MSKDHTTDYSCDICPEKASYVDGTEPVDTKGNPLWKEITFALDSFYFPFIDICPKCSEKMSSNKVVGRIAAIIKQSIESVM